MNYIKFPKDKNEIINIAKQEKLVLVRCSKGSDVNFNPQGLFFGNFCTSDGTYEDTIFSTSEWWASQDRYQGFNVYPRDYTDYHDVDWVIEDIEEYIVL